MRARLSSLLVAGGMILAVVPPRLLQASTNEAATSEVATLQGLTLETASGSGKAFTLAVPGFAGQPRLEILARPNRVVIDLPGVRRGTAVSRKELVALAGGVVLKSRIAQFAEAPQLITRLVIEVAPGTQVEVHPQAGGLRVSLEPGQGPVQARLQPLESLTPGTALAAAQPVAQPEVAAAAVQPESVARTEEAATAVIAVSEPSPAPEVGSSKPEPSASAAPAPSAPVPSVGSPFQPLPALAASALLPAASGASQEKTDPAPAPPRPADNRTGKTLGDGQQRYTGTRITMDATTEIQQFLKLIAEHARLNLVADADVTGTYTFMFHDVPWDQALDVILKHVGLGKEIQNGVIRVAKMEKLQKEEEDRKRLEEARALAGDLETITRPLSFAKVGEAKAVIEKMLSKRGAIITDDRTNTLIITDLPKHLRVVDELVATLDVQIQQVQIEARIVEASKNFLKEFGSKFPVTNAGDAKLTIGGKDAPWINHGPGGSWNSGNSGRWTYDPNTGAAIGRDKTTGLGWGTDNGIANAAGTVWLSFISDRISLNTILQAMEKEGKIKIVSTPKVVTQNNKKATILAGEKIPYPTVQAGAAGGAITVAFIEANLQLDVTPQITNDGTVLMDIKVEKAEADFGTQVQGTPRILRKMLETQVLVKDGGTTVLGGVYTTSTTDGTQGVPFLRKIPVLGWLFKSKTNNEKTAELLVFITPRILKS